MHRRDPFDNGMRRIMHRTQIKGKWRPRAFVAASGAARVNAEPDLAGVPR
jgi:hypothetical protein